MEPDSFNANMLSSRQKRELEQTGTFTDSRGRQQDATGAVVTPEQATPPPSPQPLVQDGSIDATQVTAPTSTDMPAPTADAEAETFQTGLQGQTEQARTELETTLKQERDAALKRQEELNTRLQTLMKENDPENRETFDQEQRIIQNQLDAAETASSTLEEDFKKRRATVNELDRLLTEGNQLIAEKKNQPIALSVLNKSVNRTIQDVQARAGVLQAVLTARDGNITQAHNLINTAQGTVRTYWQDQQAYNQAYMSLVESGQLAKNKIESDYAQSQITLAEQKLNQLEETGNALRDMMIDPQSAQFIADAGVTLNDSVEEINEKLAEQSRIVEIQDTKNELVGEGYEFVPFPGDRTDVVQLEVGGETLSFIPPMEEVSGGSSRGGGFTPQETRKLEQAGLIDAPRQDQLDFLYGDDSINPSVDLTPTQERGLIAAGLLATDIQQIQQDVSEFGLDSVLEGIDDENQRAAVAEAYGREAAAGAPATPEDVQTRITKTLNGIKNTYTRSEAEDLARTNLEDALGGTIPQKFEDALQDALVEVYGRTFWQSVLPGGR